MKNYLMDFKLIVMKNYLMDFIIQVIQHYFHYFILVDFLLVGYPSLYLSLNLFCKSKT